MNHIYRLVWSTTHNMLVAVAEIAGSRSKGGTPRASSPRSAARVVLAALGLLPAAAMASPTGGQVVAGQATLNQSGNTLTVQQDSSKVVINWQTFGIDANETVNFVQPGASSVALNRVLGTDASQIFGHLNANGQVFLINAAGVYFAPGAQVNVGGLVASTLDISNADFLNGNNHFSGTSTAGISNAGSITAGPGGYVAFIGNSVSNTGNISTPGGTTALGAGAGVDITLANNQLLSFNVSTAALKALASNGGIIQANGGVVILSAQAKNALLQTVVNNTGVIQAQTVANHNGTIELLGGDSGTVNVAGTLDASAPVSGNGGQIETSGSHVKVADGTVITTQSSTGNTGNWLIDPVDYTIAASGGDISGTQLSSNLNSTSVTIQSISGTTGVNGDVNVNDSVSWSHNTLTLKAQRDININAAMNATGTAGLALQYGQGSTDGVIGGVASSYNVSAPINLATTSQFSTKLGSSGTTVNYTIIDSLGAQGSTTGTDLQGINGNLSGNYVLGKNIDASSTASWNCVGVNCAGFTPIGSDIVVTNSGLGFTGAFTGTFDGLGHTITGLTVKQPTAPGGGQSTFLYGSVAGLFGIVGEFVIGSNNSVSITGGTLRNVGLINENVTGYIAGGLAGGSIFGTISNAYASGSVSGEYIVGGLIGASQGGTISDSHSTGTVTNLATVLSPTSSNGTGGLIGANLSGTISNSWSSATVNGGALTNVSGLGGNVGGLVGNNSGTISDSYATGAVTGSSNVGGLVGYSGYGFAIDATGNGTLAPAAISNSYATGTVTGSAAQGSNFRLGGLVGFNIGTISDSHATGNVIGNGSNAGGLVGFNGYNGSLNLYGTISDSYATGKVSGSDYVGGLVGANSNGSISDAYATGSVTASGRAVGGLVGFNGYDNNSNISAGPHGAISNAYATGSVSGGERVGGLVGDNSNGSVSSSYATGTVSGGSYVGGLVGDNSNGSISDSHASGSATGVGTFNLKIGGLAGSNSNGSITNSYATGSVTGRDFIGGLVGDASNGIISNAYATGKVSGHDYVGGLAGNNSNGTISNAYASGSVSGNSNVGGLVGDNSNGSISNAYAVGSVSGNSSVGGLVGNNDAGSITNTYAVGKVSGTTSVGGLVGYNDTGVITNGYFDTTTTTAGQAGVGGGLTTGVSGKTTAQLAAALPSGFTSSVWSIGDKQTTPYLLANSSFGTVSGSVILGSDSSAAPTHYGLILNLTQLQNINTTGLSDNYVLGTNIDATATSGWNNGAGFAPIGFNSNNQFTGIFDGLGHAVSNLTINRPASTYIGLFGVNDGTIRNVGVVGGSIIGYDAVGALVGFNGGTISNAYASALVNGNGNIDAEDSGSTGGLVGENYYGTISNSHATGNVTGTDNVGGLVGDNNSGTISNSYATGTVNGSNTVGGLVGVNIFGMITNNYATGNVSTSDTMAGGLVGANYYGDVSNSYAIGSVSGSDTIGGLLGSSSGGSINNVYASGLVSGSSAAGGLVGLVSGTTLSNGYWNVDSTGKSTSQGFGTSSSGPVTGGGGLSNAAMMQQSSFTGFDFSNVWIIYNGHTAPLLRSFMANLTVTSDNQTQTYNGGTFALSNASYSITGADTSGRLYGLTDSYGGAKNAGTTSYAPDLWSDQQGYIISYSGGALTINPLALILSGSRTYNGSASIAGSILTASNLVSGDSLTISGNGTLASKNAGNETISSFAGLTLNNSNYTLVGASGSVNIAQAVLTMNNLSASNKTYDGTAVAAASGTLVGVISGDKVSDTLTANFDDKNAGSDKTVTVNANTLSGADAGNYSISGVNGQTTTADISKAALTLNNLNASNKTYDGSAVATASGTLSGVISGDKVSDTLTANFDNKNAGSGKTVTVSANTLGGADAGNYSISNGQTTTADIAQAALTLSNINASNKVYDGTAVATASGTLNGVISGDKVTDALTASFDDKNAGNGKTVTVSANTLGGADAGNYSISGVNGQTTTADISKAALTLNNLHASNKTYDGSAVATASGTLSGVISDDKVTDTLTANFDDKNAGTGKTVTVSANTLGGADAGNYSISGVNGQTTTADISKAALTLSNLNASNKTYDGNAVATASGTLDGVISGDKVTDALTASFDDKNAGTGKTVTVSDNTLSGADAGNYSISSGQTTTADIAQATLTLSNLNVSNKTYDGSAVATASGTLSGVISGDKVTDTLTASFDNKNAGTGKTVTVSDNTLSGVDAGNYSISNGQTATADIAQATLTVTGLVGTNKTYDGSTSDPLGGTAVLNGLVDGETLTLGNATTGTLASANPGVEAVTTNLTISNGSSGDLASNYKLIQPTLADVFVYSSNADTGWINKLEQGGYIVPSSGPSLGVDPAASYHLTSGPKPTGVHLEVCTVGVFGSATLCHTRTLDPLANTTTGLNTSSPMTSPTSHDKS